MKLFVPGWRRGILDYLGSFFISPIYLQDAIWVRGIEIHFGDIDSFEETKVDLHRKRCPK
jgi:hypothetical protein